ncbi:Ribosomal RNA small subunit methyltransferase H [Buchnera aphidicola (Eriosoma grossulariae)]|uniref:16S rRNA (cytosine(1402)-N(4))-methyltransferase RsmH n=1 Tax=Buchnera aphidicola TaxID=9 RepID=UPI003464D128
MINKQLHIPIMLNEVIKFLNIKKNGIYLDATFGYGGHSKKILQNLGKEGKIFAIDKDPESKKYSNTINDSRLHFIHGNFSKIYHYAKKLNFIKKINGIIIDLGVSSPQLDNPKRGFSFMKDGPLDMRMNPQENITASKWLLQTKENNLFKILKNYGEESYAKKIACAIIQQNKKKPITRTLELSNLIEKIVSKKYRKKHPATKSFQAIRIFINNELEEIKILLKNVINILTPGGRLLIITFHSLEDRIVKNFINQNSNQKIIPINLPINETILSEKCNFRFKKIDKINPTKQEINTNKRSRSATLRIAELIK